jgi:hypothetical protein
MGIDNGKNFSRCLNPERIRASSRRVVLQISSSRDHRADLRGRNLLQTSDKLAIFSVLAPNEERNETPKS